jgi:hypothetical protein
MAERYASELAKLLEPFMMRQPQLEKIVREKVVDPAMNLAHKLHLSAKKYSLVWPAATEGGQVAAQDLSNYKCLDLKDGSVALVPAVSGAHASRGGVGRSGGQGAAQHKFKYLFDVAPELRVDDFSGQETESRLIAKGTVVVAKKVEEAETFLKWLGLRRPRRRSRH